MFATTSSYIEIKNLSTFVVYSDTQRSTWVSERGTFNSVKNRTLYTDPVLFFCIAALHVYMLVVLGHLINKSKFSFHLLYTHTKHKWILHVQDYHSLKISEKNFTALNRQYYLKGQNITNQLLHIKIISTRLFWKKTT